MKIENADITLKANVYFDGKVVSHTVEKNGRKQTVGLIYSGAYTFNTGVPERMDIIAGECSVKLAGENIWKKYAAGSFFQVPGKSSFQISVENGIAEYLCSYE